MEELPKPEKEAMIYEDEKLYVCMASYPIAKGHTVVVWKENKEDLHLLSREDFEYLMDKVDQVRNALLKALNLEKVYLIYMDEVRQVHWHLVPRYNKKGFDVFRHEPEKTSDFSLASVIKNNMDKKI